MFCTNNAICTTCGTGKIKLVKFKKVIAIHCTNYTCGICLAHNNKI